MRDIPVEDIYNTYLRVFRKKQNKPFKRRIDFTNIQTEYFFKDLVRLKSFLDRNYTVNVEDFFASPYEVYEDKSAYTLDYYTTLNASKVYALYCNLKNNLDPDSDACLLIILKGIKFIENFCKQAKIPLDQYLLYKEKDSLIPAFILHLKENNTSIYNLFPFKNFESELSKIDFPTLKFILNDKISKIAFYRTKFFSSVKNKNLSSKGLKIVEKNINTHLNS